MVQTYWLLPFTSLLPFPFFVLFRFIFCMFCDHVFIDQDSLIWFLYTLTRKLMSCKYTLKNFVLPKYSYSVNFSEARIILGKHGNALPLKNI